VYMHKQYQLNLPETISVKFIHNRTGIPNMVYSMESNADLSKKETNLLIGAPEEVELGGRTYRRVSSRRDRGKIFTGVRYRYLKYKVKESE